MRRRRGFGGTQGLVVAALGLAGAAVTLALAGCGPSSLPGASAPPAGHPSSTPMAGAPTTSAVAPSATGAASGSGGSSTPVTPIAGGGSGSAGTATPPHCLDEQLAGAYGPDPAGSSAGHYHGIITFTNTSSTACSFNGWPGVIALDAGGARIGNAIYSIGTNAPVTIVPGGTAVVRLTGAQPDIYGCAPLHVTQLRAYITSDGVGPGIPIATSIDICSDGPRNDTIGPLQSS